MARVKLKGIATVIAKGRTYHYAWRGGPRLRGEPGSAEYVASYLEAHESLKVSDPGRFRSLVTLYKRSDAYKKLADRTREVWGPWLDRISEHFGDLRIAQFDRLIKIRPSIRKWRGRWLDRPRTADFAIQVLSRVLSYAVEEGKINENACAGLETLYKADRSDIIWTDADLAQLKKTCSPEIAHAVDFASHTGLRFSDLIKCSWSHVGELAIVMTTGKSGPRRREAMVPLYSGLRTVLACIPKRSPTILTNSWGRPWSFDGLGSSFNKAKRKAGLSDRDLHFHDLRGTAATRMYVAGLTEREIAEVLAWEEEHVSRIIRRYVGRNAALKSMIDRIDRAERRT